MAELQGLQLQLPTITAAGASLLAVSVDPPERNRTVASRFGLGFPVLSDPDRTLIRALALQHPGAGPKGAEISRPATYVVAPDNRILWRDLTENYRQRPRPEAVVARLKPTP